MHVHRYNPTKHLNIEEGRLLALLRPLYVLCVNGLVNKGMEEQW